MANKLKTSLLDIRQIWIQTKMKYHYKPHMMAQVKCLASNADGVAFTTEIIFVNSLYRISAKASTAKW